MILDNFLMHIEPLLRSFLLKVEVRTVLDPTNHAELYQVVISLEQFGAVLSRSPIIVKFGCQDDGTRALFAHFVRHQIWEHKIACLGEITY